MLVCDFFGRFGVDLAVPDSPSHFGISFGSVRGRRRHPLIFYLTAFEGSVVGDPAYPKNLRKFGSGELTQEKLAALEAELYSGPDQVAAVVLASLVDRSIGHLIKRSMREDGIGDIFSSDGLLGKI